MDTCHCYDYKYLHKGKALPSGNSTENACNLDDDAEGKSQLRNYSPLQKCKMEALEHFVESQL